MASNYPEGAEFDPRNPINEDDLCSDCRDAEAMPNRTVCRECLQWRMEDGRLERTRQD